jgi:hypothetical protein
MVLTMEDIRGQPFRIVRRKTRIDPGSAVLPGCSSIAADDRCSNKAPGCPLGGIRQTWPLSSGQYRSWPRYQNIPCSAVSRIDRFRSRSYVASLVGDTWQTIIPVSGKLSPLAISKQRFCSKLEAEEWLASPQGQAVVSFVHEHRALPSEDDQAKLHVEKNV